MSNQHSGLFRKWVNNFSFQLGDRCKPDKPGGGE